MAATKGNTKVSMEQALKLYRSGNNNGSGYAPYADDVADDSIDAAIAAAEADGWTLDLSRDTSEDLAVLYNDDGECMAIGGDATGHAAWAVILTDLVSEWRAAVRS